MDWINLVIIPAVKSIILVVVLLTGFAYLTWVERKLIGRFQQRIGPNRAWKFGLGHPIADALKMVFKEETVPSYTDKILFVLGPALAIVPALLIFAVIPVGPPISLFGRKSRWCIQRQHRHPVGAGGTGIGTYGIILGGWASNNKYSLLGALRTSSQMMSYELPMGLLLMAMLLVYGTLNLNEIVTPVVRCRGISGSGCCWRSRSSSSPCWLKPAGSRSIFPRLKMNSWPGTRPSTAASSSRSTT